MFAKSKWFITAGIALVLAFVFTTCEDLNSNQIITGDPTVPTITAQPTGGAFNLGDANAKLTVTATVTDKGKLGYQWYTVTDEQQYTDGGGTPIPNATAAQYTVNLTEGAYQAYVLVTNKIGDKTASVKSNLIRVTVNNPANAQYPNITAEPVSVTYDWSGSTITADPISVTASVTDGGTLTYQWYSSTTASTSGGTPIDGATGASYTPTITAQGTNYYYVAITNTRTEASGRPISSLNSSIAAIRVVSANATITVNTTKAQYVRGYGGMAPFWGNAPQDDPRDYETMFNPDTGLGLNMLRVMVPVSSSTDMKETMRMALNNELSGEKDRTHYFEIVKIVNKYNGYVLASPWSPPAQWKTNGSINGAGAGGKANLIKSYWGDYADYLKDYCKIMYDNGAPIYALSIQNEPNFEADYDGCEWLGAEMRDFFIQNGRFTAGIKGFGGGQEIPYVLLMNGESANSPTINDPVLDDPTANQIVDLYARHIYGSPQVTRSAQAQALGKEIWMTEYNVNSGNEATYPNDSTYNYMWKFINCIDLVIRLNKENAFIWWYGKRFYAMVGDGTAGTADGAILPRGYALSHYAKYSIDTDQVGLTVTGTTAANVPLITGSATGHINNTSYNLDSTLARATAFMTRDGNSISLVMFTPTNINGGNGIDMGNVKIQFPDGFTATKVTAMRTKEGALGQVDNDTVLLRGGTAALVSLPAGQILSVKFTK